MNLPNEEHFKTLFEMIVQSCEEQQLGVMRVKHTSSDSIHFAVVSFEVQKEKGDDFSAKIVPLALLLSPEMASSIEPLPVTNKLGSDEWQIIVDECPTIELDDRKRWRPPTKGLL